MNQPKTVRVEVQIQVVEEYDTVAETTLTERVTLNEERRLDSAVGALDHIATEAVSKTRAQMTAFEQAREAAPKAAPEPSPL